MAASFYLYNNYSTSYLSLDPTSSGFGLRALKTASSFLTFTFNTIPSTNFVKICTNIASKPYCLDVWGDKKTVPHLSDPGDYSGQQWSLITARNGFVKLSNEYTGKGWFLDVYSDTNGAFMSEMDYTGQYWKQEAASSTASSSSPTRSAVPTFVAFTISDRGSPTQTSDKVASLSATIDATPLSSTSLNPIALPAKSSDLSTAAKAGIGAGCAVLALVLASLVFAILYWKRKARRNNTNTAPVAIDEKPVFPAQGEFALEPKQAFVGTAELASPDSSPHVRSEQVRMANESVQSHRQVGGNVVAGYTFPVGHSPVGYGQVNIGELTGSPREVHEMDGRQR